MKKYVKILFKSKEIPLLHLSLEKWSEILESEKILIAYKLDNEEDWTGRVFNKLEIVWAEYDEEYSKKANEIKFALYRRLSDNVIVKLTEGQLPDDINNYEKI